VLDRWIDALLSTPGLTAISDHREAWRVHVDDALTALPLLGEGPLVDVGSGGGSPGIPLAFARPDLEVTLLEASSGKCAFLRRAVRELPNVSVVHARAEEHARAAGRDHYGTAVARALGPAPVTVEWCLPLVRPGGRAILYLGKPDSGRVAAVAGRLSGALREVVPVPGSRQRHLVVLQKLGRTPREFPRRPGAARKRPLAQRPLEA
jgi:16S rRNA (guanine527-N7)-methyltransferase